MSRIQQGIAKEHPEWILPRLCQKNANKTGVYAAIFFGVITLPIARRFGLDKNRALFSALGASGIAGYIAAKYTYAHCERTYGFFQGMEHIQTEELRKQNQDNQNDSEMH